MHRLQKWLKQKDVYEYCGITKRTLQEWRKMGLEYSKLPSGTVLINRDNLDAFIKKFSVTDNEIEKMCDQILKSF